MNARKIFSSTAVLIAFPPVWAMQEQTLKEQWEDIIFRNDPNETESFVWRHSSFNIGFGSEHEARLLLRDAVLAYKKLEATVHDAMEKTLKKNLEKNIPGEITKYVYGTFPIRLVTSSKAFFTAILNRHWEVFNFLITKGADPNTMIKDVFNHKYPLLSFIADMRRSKFRPDMPLQAAKQLIDAAGVDLNLGDTGGNTALHHTIRQRDWSLFDELLKAGADPNAQGSSLQTPLHLIVDSFSYGREEDTEELMKAATQLIQAPSVDLTLKDRDGLTALEHAKKEFELADALPGPFGPSILPGLIQLLEKAGDDRIASIPEEMKSENIN